MASAASRSTSAMCELYATTLAGQSNLLDHRSISTLLRASFAAVLASDLSAPRLRYILKAANALSLSFSCCSNASAIPFLSYFRSNGSEGRTTRPQGGWFLPHCLLCGSLSHLYIRM